MEHFNQLTPAEHERLSILLEELGEAQQAIGKIMRHGYENHHPDFPEKTNRDDLERELAHVEFMITQLVWFKDVTRENMSAYRFAKSKSIEQYLHHQD